MADDVLAEQIAYYRARAGEYDEWFLRQGQFDLGEDFNARWSGEVDVVADALGSLAPFGRVLELACGTGWWTQRLARHAASVTAVDASPEAIALNRARVRSERVRYVEADLFSWQPGDRYDLVFFSFWLSHVPHDRFEPFWEMVSRAGDRAFFVDNLRKEIPELDALRRFLQRDTSEDGVVVRRLNDGREFRAVKVYHEPSTLAARLASLGWRADVRETDWFFYYGSAERG
jgi:demethylmenaquinone methyltransferase/2-methoxy-6-polyprenyl-1,4-benzoquinol methylase